MAFKHEKLNDASRFIRLFNIDHGTASNGKLRLSLTEHSVQTADAENPSGIIFTALSYTWGPPQPCHEILVNQRPFMLRENLYQFLRNLSASEIVNSFWADAICINQDDIGERNVQVAMMGKIFRSATSVLAWIGQPAAPNVAWIFARSRLRQDFHDLRR